MSRRIAITGVSRGLGRAMVDQLIAAGHHVFGCATNRPAIDALQSQYPQHHFAVVDISHADQVRGWADEVLALGDPPDLLLNNAAVINQSVPLWEVHEREFENVLNVNIAGTFHTIKYFLRP